MRIYLKISVYFAPLLNILQTFGVDYFPKLIRHSLRKCPIYFIICVCAFYQLQEGCRKNDSLSSLPHALFNYINSIVGSGIIGIPYALHRAGFGLGLLILALVAVITDYSLILMVRLH